MSHFFVMKVSYRPLLEGLDKAGALINSSSQRLLYPIANPFVESRALPEQLNGSLEDQVLVVPKTLMSPHGAQCDHVGVGLGAFLGQTDPCREPRHSCLKNQPFDLWKQDQGPTGDPKQKFRLKSFSAPRLPAEISEHKPITIVELEKDFKTGKLYLEHKAASPTYVDIEIPADDVIILAPGYNAFIESVLTDTGSDGVKIVAQVLNKELVEAEFNVDLVQCTLDVGHDEPNPNEKTFLEKVKTTSAKMIGPLNSRRFVLDVHTDKINQPVFCFLVLVNEFHESIAAREIIFQPGETCICAHTCKCACGDKNTRCERLSDENIIGAGLSYEIRTAAEITDEEAAARSYVRWHRWIHLILAFHIILIILACVGFIHRQCNKEPDDKPPSKDPSSHNEKDENWENWQAVEEYCGEGFGEVDVDNTDVDENQFTISRAGSETTLYEKEYELAPSYSQMQIGKESSRITSPTAISTSGQSRYPRGNYDEPPQKGQQDSNLNQNEFQPATTNMPAYTYPSNEVFDNQGTYQSYNEPEVQQLSAHPSMGNDTQQANASPAVIGAQQQMSTTSSVALGQQTFKDPTVFQGQQTSKYPSVTFAQQTSRNPSIIEALQTSRNPSVTDAQQTISYSSATTGTEIDKNLLQESVTDFSQKSSGAPLSQMASALFHIVPPVNKEQSQTLSANQNDQSDEDEGGAQAADISPNSSKRSPFFDNTDYNAVDLMLNCVSASNSQNSFRTWDRRRRDQFTAYDFLPEPKSRGSYN